MTIPKDVKFLDFFITFTSGICTNIIITIIIIYEYILILIIANPGLSMSLSSICFEPLKKEISEKFVIFNLSNRAYIFLLGIFLTLILLTLLQFNKNIKKYWNRCSA